MLNTPITKHRNRLGILRKTVENAIKDAPKKFQKSELEKIVTGEIQLEENCAERACDEWLNEFCELVDKLHAAEDEEYQRQLPKKDSGSKSVIEEVQSEVERATSKFPTWPTDALHAVGVVGEEMGELQKEVMQLTYEPHKSSLEKVRTEAIQLAAMSLRFLMSLDNYEYRPGEQHAQDVTK